MWILWLFPLLFSYFLYGDPKEISDSAEKTATIEAFSEVESSVTKVNIPIPSHVTLPGQAIQAGRIYTYWREIEDLLTSSAFDFFRAVKAEEKGQSIFNQMTRIQGEKSTSFQNTPPIYDPAFYEAALSLLIAVTPPLGKKDGDGLNASELAEANKNQALYRVFQKHRRIKSRFELDPKDKTDFWSRQITLIPLENHPVAQAILREDPKALYQAMAKAFSDPAKDFLPLLHSRTSDHKTLFHLSAEVKSHKKEIAQAIDQLITFSAPNKVDFVERKYDYSKVTAQDALAMGAGWSSLLLGLPTSIYFFSSNQGGLGTLTFLLSAVGLKVCERAFRTNRTTDSIIKNP